MDYPRAKQIFESPQVIPVNYKGNPIWIESLDPESKMASVSREREKLTVPIQELEEGDM
ncbi:MAG: H-type small acid-soluble spore protein [Bacillota bacterium]